MVKAMQELQASGNGLPADASTQQKQQYIDRVKNWTRILFFTKTALGFAAPASPTEEFDPTNLSGRLTTLMNELPYDQAVSEFLKENPNASAYTVFDSTSTGGAELPSTQAAANFLNSNADFVKEYPQAAGWLIPRTMGNEPFNAAAYREQIQYGLRDTKTPESFLDDIITAPAASQYYNGYDEEQASLAQVKNDPAQASAIRANWDQESQQFLAQNPTFAQSLTSSTKKVQREETIDELNTALEDPSIPESAQTDQVRTLLQGFDAYQQSYSTLLGQTSTAAEKEKDAMKANFIAEGNEYAQENPAVSDMWNVLIRPEVTDTEAGLADTTSAQLLTGATNG